jgi:hypothetical protein
MVRIASVVLVLLLSACKPDVPCRSTGDVALKESAEIIGSVPVSTWRRVERMQCVDGSTKWREID